MPSNNARFIKNFGGDPEPLIMLGLFDAGATTAIKRGEMLELTGTGNTVWVPMDSDADLSSGYFAIANEEIKAGDRAGYYEIIVPREDDVFRFDIDTAAATALGTALYWSDSETLSASGSNILGDAAGQDHYPRKQGHLADDGSADAGTTIRSVATVDIVIQKSNSYLSQIVTA